MKNKNKFFTLFFGVSLLFAGLAGAGLSHKSDLKEVKADGEPNNTFGYIYDDTFNNQNNNLTLFVFEGTATGLAETTAITDPTIKNKVKVNGLDLSTIGGSLAVWGGNNWFQVTYPNSNSYEGATLTFESGVVAGDAILDGCSFRMNSELKWKRVFTDAVNAKYSSIFSDDWNNTQHATGYNRLMFRYTGASHNHPAAINKAESLKNFDLYIQIDGAPISSFAGGSTQVAPWSGQTWIQIIYPATAIDVGSRLVIEEGCRIGDAVFEKIVFILNGSSKWEKIINLIDDDTLVKNSDYKLFTISDYTFNVNDGVGFLWFPASDFVDAMSDSFGFRFIVNIPDGQLSTAGAAILKFAGTDIFGSGAIIQITLNYSDNVYLTFNASIDQSTSVVHSWSVDEDHLVEVYFIKTSATSANILLGIDGGIIFKSGSKDITGLTFRNFFTATGPANTASYYSSATDTTEKAVSRFNERKLHVNDIPFDNNDETDGCKTYYGEAKSFYNNLLTKNQRKEFATSASYSNHRARLVAWGAANGETVSFNGSTGDLVINSNSAVLSAIVENKNYSIIIIVISFIAISSLMGFFVFKKKKQQ